MPRPYECVRRVWHSDRHQPIRGSIIQRIFRVVSEGHSSNTKKNREWQEKLPKVVLKAEEILYSKADSEAEYVDVDTLWDRLNDAIDTIIRRDKSTETGQFLQPCIEATLVLGCVPVRATRSQRHNDPRTYLSPRFNDTVQASPTTPNKINNHGPFSRQLPPSGNQLTTPRPGMANPACSPTTSYAATQNVQYYHQSLPRPIPSDPSGVYPLYHTSHRYPNVESAHRFHASQNNYSGNVIIGRPVTWHRVPPTKNEEVGPLDIHGKGTEMGCDLSLRLGPSDSGASSHQETKNVELSLFPRHTANNPCELRVDSIEREEVLDMSRSLGKRKAEEDVSGQRGPKVQRNQFDGENEF